MKTRRLLLTAAAMLVLGSAAMAQDGTVKSFSYVELQGGAQLTATNAPMDKLITPTVGLSLGHYFTPVVGARLHLNAWQSKSGFKPTDQYYKWKYVTPDLDLMLNLSNLFCQNGSHTLNVILLGGFGLNYAWDNDELKGLGVDPTWAPLAWDENRLNHNLRAGLRLETNQSKPLGLSLEVNANSIDDRFNSKTNDADDWMFTAMIGLSYRFGHQAGSKSSKPTPAPVVRQVVEQEKPADVSSSAVVEEKPAPVVVEPEKPAPVTRTVVKREPVKLHKEVFYAIRMSDNDDHAAAMREVADFMKQYKDVKVSVVGYADRGTGNAQLNKMYSQKRANQFKQDIVKQYRVSAAAITTDAKGDTVQPFADNDKNRCVIVDAEGYKEVETTVTE